MRWCLLVAAAYNLAWGAAAVLAPVWMLRTLGVESEPGAVMAAFWACIGMIVGVYGVGYAVASRDPLRHWPIVLVGLLGKVFGPLGFVDAAMSGVLPWSMGWTIVTNDLVWWVPFGVILWRAWGAAQLGELGPKMNLDEALGSLRDEEGVDLLARTHEGPVLVVLVRHTGCTFCRETLADLARGRGAIERAGLSVAVVGLGEDTASMRAMGERLGVRGARWYADPGRVLYRALGLGRGRFGQLFGPRVWIRGLAATLRGHVVGRPEGDGFQMPGAFVIHEGRVVRGQRHRYASDRLRIAELSCPAG